MKRITAVILLLVVAVSLSPGRTKQATRGGGAEQELRRLEAELAQAALKADTSFLDRVMADDYTAVNASGLVRDKAQALADFKSGDLKLTALNLDVEGVRTYGDAVLVTGLATMKGTYRGQDISGQNRYIRVYVRRDGRWQAVAFQLTRIAQQ